MSALPPQSKHSAARVACPLCANSGRGPKVFQFQVDNNLTGEAVRRLTMERHRLATILTDAEGIDFPR